MYVPNTGACDLPNSETPLTQREIDAQARRISRIGAKFIGGNATMSRLIGSMTPPPPVGTCEDFTTSASMYSLGRFPLTANDIAILAAAGFPVPPVSAASMPTAASATPGSPVSKAIQNPAAANQAAMDYPLPAIQRVTQLLVPPACTNLPGPEPGAPGLKFNRTAALWIVGAVAAAAVLLSGNRRPA